MGCRGGDLSIGCRIRVDYYDAISVTDVLLMLVETGQLCEQQSASAAFVILDTTMGYHMLLEMGCSCKCFITDGAFERFNLFMNFSAVLFESISRLKSFIAVGAAEIFNIRMD